MKRKKARGNPKHDRMARRRRPKIHPGRKLPVIRVLNTSKYMPAIEDRKHRSPA